MKHVLGPCVISLKLQKTEDDKFAKCKEKVEWNKKTGTRFSKNFLQEMPIFHFPDYYLWGNYQPDYRVSRLGCSVYSTMV